MQGFQWQVPAVFNIAEVCCRRWARSQPEAVAVRAEDEAGRVRLTRYGALQRDADRLSLALRRLGVRPGDRVAVVMPQRVETAVAHIAIYQLGAVAMPLSQLFGPEALEYRLNDSDAVVALVDASTAAAINGVRVRCPALRAVLAVGSDMSEPDPGTIDWRTALARESAEASPAVHTRADDPAVLIYTSGTTGPPKGALIPHRALIGNLSGFVCSQNWLRSGSGQPAASAPGAGRGASRRRVLEPRRLGLDRRADGRAVALPVLWRADRGLLRSVLGRARPWPAAASPRHQQLSVPDRAQGHDEGGAAAAAQRTGCGFAPS